MSLPEKLYAIAFITFLLGAAWSYRSNGSIGSLIVIVAAVTLDFLVTVLPIAAFKFNVEGSNSALVFGSMSGLATWILAIIAFALRWRQSFATYHVVIAVTQVVWFLCYIAFLFGIHVVPLS